MCQIQMLKVRVDNKAGKEVKAVRQARRQSDKLSWCWPSLSKPKLSVMITLPFFVFILSFQPAPARQPAALMPAIKLVAQLPAKAAPATKTALPVQQLADGKAGPVWLLANSSEIPSEALQLFPGFVQPRHFCRVEVQVQQEAFILLKNNANLSRRTGVALTLDFSPVSSRTGR